MNNSNYLWLLDAGHGGIDSNGRYTTAPNKMQTFAEGLTVFEGVVNRAVAERAYKQLQQVGIDFYLIYDEVYDTPLSQRIALANKATTKQHDLYQRKCILLSIHSNAGGGKGFELFTSPGHNDSDEVAKRLAKVYIKNFPEYPWRKGNGGELDKEEAFAMVGGNKKMPLLCAAVLIENLFFDEINQAKFLLSEEGQQRIADSIVEWIMDIELTKPI